MKLKHIFELSLFMILMLRLSGCGSNVYEMIDPADPAEEAVVALEKQDPEKAIHILEQALRGDPMNPQYLSLLASAKAQLAGVDTIDLALRLVQDQGNSEANEITQLFDIMPTPSPENLELLTQAVEAINLIPNQDLMNSDRFKLSMFFTSLMTLRTKAFDLNGDGVLSPDELAMIDDEAALAILQDLILAEASLGGSHDDGDQADAAAQVSSIRSKIESEEGDSDAEKLRNFLGR